MCFICELYSIAMVKSLLIFIMPLLHCRSNCLLIGEIDEDDECISDDRDWNAYWRLLFKPITKKDILDFEKKHRGK